MHKIAKDKVTKSWADISFIEQVDCAIEEQISYFAADIAAWEGNVQSSSYPND
jgi:hypothetical protein